MSSKEIILAKTDDLQNGEMKKITLDDEREILLSRVDDSFYATEAYCTHYGAPLDTGVICGNRIICPWHHAVFKADSGKLCDPPALDGLGAYDLQVRGKDVLLIGEKPKKVPSKKEDSRTFVIVGGGAAGNAAALALREFGFKGHLIIVSADEHPPYDRPNLSKDFLQGDFEMDWLPLREKGYYSDNKIEIILNQKVKELDTAKREVALEAGQRLKYDKLLLATGGRPRKLHTNGSDLKNVFTLRTRNDAEKILKVAEKSKNIAVVGASFIGMETAENLHRDGKNVSIIAPEEVPFAGLFGKKFGEMIRKKQEEAGLSFHLGRKVQEFKGSGKVSSVLLDNGDSVDADMVIVGIGVEPVSDFINSLPRDKDNSLVVDAHLAAAENVYAAGDIATFPYAVTGNKIRVEHWRVADQLGRIAAQNMLGLDVKADIVPFFWTSLAGLRLRYVGHVKEWNETIVAGDINSDDFMICYVKDGRLLAALATGRDKEMAAFEELLRLGKMPEPKALGKIKPNTFQQILKSACGEQ